jgi:hypothetical protein
METDGLSDDTLSRERDKNLVGDIRSEVVVPTHSPSCDRINRVDVSADEF